MGGDSQRSGYMDGQVGDRDRNGPVALVVDDPFGLPDQLSSLLTSCGCDVVNACHVDAAEATAGAQPCMVVVNIVNLRAMNPLQVQALRKTYRSPIVCLLPYPAAQEIAQVGALGAEVVIFKPLRAEEFESRIRLLLWQQRPESSYPVFDRRCYGRRREDRAAVPGRGLSRDPAPFQLSEREKVAYCDGQRVRLTPKEFALLSLLASDMGRTCCVGEIVRVLWPERRRAGAADVHQVVYTLRKKIEKDPCDPQRIVTIPRYGYMLSI